MAQLRVGNSRIAGICCAVPKKVVDNTYFEEFLSIEDIQQISRMTGVHRRRWVDSTVCTSDLCYEATRKLLERLDWSADTIDLVVVVTQTPDYCLPATACVLHGRLGLSPSCAAFDINLGCSGYVYGLNLLQQMMATGMIRRGLLLAGDTISKITAPTDRSTRLLFGDAGTATALEYSPESCPSYYVLGTDGSGARNLIVEEGGFRSPVPNSSHALSSEEGSKQVNPVHLYMEGGEIFNFTIRTINPLLDELLKVSQRYHENIDYFIFHQANEFMLKYLAKLAKLPVEKVPTNIKNFGNTSSASIPLALVSELSTELCSRAMTLALLGFGVGYSWAAGLITTDASVVVELVEV